MRHAKSSWETQERDHDRPLGKRGYRQAFAAGEYLASNHRIDQVLCSTSTRTRQTLERVFEAGAEAPVTYLEQIYETGIRGLVNVLQTQASGDTVLLLGHNPGVYSLVHYLGHFENSDVWNEVDSFVTSGIATLSVPDPWSELQPGNATLMSFVAPGRG